eukprot:evm.model.NODE_19262_length_43251_cov_28.561583.9
MTLLIVAPTLAVAFAAGHSASSPSTSRGSSSTQDRPVKMHRGLQKRTSFVVLEEFAHDPEAFTQGLVYEDDGTLLEGTGLYGKSKLRRINAKTGEVMASEEIDERYFGEGIVAVDDKIIQITWKERKALVYGRQNLTLLNEFVYDTSKHEGWGITTDGNRLIVSDGSSNLHFWDKTTYQEIPNSRLRVEDGFGNAVHYLNELEYAYGYVWANIWLADDIVQIDPSTGKVVAFYDFSVLYPHTQRVSVDQVLNGIAYDSTEDVFYLTGKWWPKYFKVKMCIEENAVCAAEGGAGDEAPPKQ